ncbi:MAG: HIT family protein [Bowdeniella nasicola]|nr:HIT family protein [Bowdeniella nasicola]
MASIFTRIINGEIPGRFVWADERVVAFLDAFPQTDGHVLVVPREEIDRWTDLPDDLAARLFHVGHLIGKVLPETFDAPRTGVVIEGFEVPHTHLHLFPARGPQDFDASNKTGSQDAADQDEAARRIRAALREAGHGASVPDEPEA